MRDLGLILKLADPGEVEWLPPVTSTWRIAWTIYPQRCKETDMNEWLSLSLSKQVIKGNMVCIKVKSHENYNYNIVISYM